MDPHYHLVPASEGAYEAISQSHYEYAVPHTSYQRDDPYTQSQNQGPPYDTVMINAHTTPQPTPYTGYTPSQHAMEYVQSMYHMQFAQEMANGFSENIPYGARAMITGDNRRKRRRIITHEQRKAANIRERRRMFHLNEAFDQLRKRVPTFAYEKKLSRIETLKLAVTYIKFMGDLVEEIGGETTPLNTSCSSSKSGASEETKNNGGDLTGNSSAKSSPTGSPSPRDEHLQDSDISDLDED